MTIAAALDAIASMAAEHYLAMVALYITLRALTIIIPPLQGFAVDIVGIGTFGWIYAFIYSEIGIMLGASIAYEIGRFVSSRREITSNRRFVWTAEAVKRAVLKLEQRWNVRLDHLRGFWIFVGIRAVTNPLFDGICYAGGFMKMDRGKFFMGTLLGNIPSVFIFFMVGRFVVKQQIILGVVYLLLILLLGFFLQRHDFRIMKSK